VTGCLRLAIAIVTLAGVVHADSGDTRVERTDGRVTRGTLLAIDPDSVTITTAEGPAKLPLADVRRVVLDQTTKAAPAPIVKVLLVDGGELSGTDVTQADGTLVVASSDGEIKVPTERVKRVAWTDPGGAEPAWVSGLPPEPASDLLVVNREGGHEFVECAVTGLGADAVSVVLDGDTIPVKRAKVAGIVWLREQRPPAGGIVVIVRGGRLQASAVRWSPKGFVIDDGIQMPAASLRSIDFAAGRTVPLASIEPERIDFEPFFGGLRDVPGLAAFFEPRTITPPTEDGPSVLLVRPRSVLTYRVPADSRRFHATIERDVPATSTAQVDVVVTVDENEVVRRRIDVAAAAKPLAIDTDVTGARRITLTIDFVKGDIGCGLRISGAAFEK
jgi:hypothetical protein